MKKIILFVSLLGCIGYTAYGQHASTSARQRVTMHLHNVLEFTFTNTGTNKGNTVMLPFSTLSNYQEGVSSPAQVLRIRSNKKFEIAVQANSPYFNYSGNVLPTPNMPVDKVLNMEIASNSTGGQLTGPFSSGKYVKVTANNTNILSNCMNGGDQQFSIRYKASPGINYPVGTYTVDIVYTATQQ